LPRSPSSHWAGGGFLGELAEASTPRYRVIDLGTFGNPSHSNFRARAINEDGRIVGTYDVSGSAFRSFVWTHEAFGIMASPGLYDLADLYSPSDPASGSFFAADLNDAGEVVGFLEFDAGGGPEQEAYLWDLAVLTGNSNLNDDLLSDVSRAYAINDEVPARVVGIYLDHEGDDGTLEADAFTPELELGEPFRMTADGVTIDDLYNPNVNCGPFGPRPQMAAPLDISNPIPSLSNQTLAPGTASSPKECSYLADPCVDAAIDGRWWRDDGQTAGTETDKLREVDVDTTPSQGPLTYGFGVDDEGHIVGATYDEEPVGMDTVCIRQPTFWLTQTADPTLLPMPSGLEADDATVRAITPVAGGELRAVGIDHTLTRAYLW